MAKTAPVRSIQKVWKSEPTIEGAGVHLKRAFGFRELPQFDPFLLLDDFRSDIPADYLAGFPWHPHRGIETITYVLDGDVEHEDSLGNGGVISSGDIQWMTAGSGILHQEMPKGNKAGAMVGFQLWANLPAAQKMMDPRYRDVKSGTVPVVQQPGGVEVRVVAGMVGGVQGPVKDIVIDPEYLDVTVPAHAQWEHPVRPDHSVFAYVIDGEGYFEPGRDAFAHESVGLNYFDMKVPCVCPNHTLVLYGPGQSVQVATQGRPVRFLLVSGRPLKEPIAWYGPIVMNTRAELRQAFEEFEKGTFVKKAGERA
ncbi:MAG: pirin family protein [Elusimicrobia bacterium]|nr:pirin family protein [Elusimicrobiota bacterium]